MSARRLFYVLSMAASLAAAAPFQGPDLGLGVRLAWRGEGQGTLVSASYLIPLSLLTAKDSVARYSVRYTLRDASGKTVLDEPANRQLSSAIVRIGGEMQQQIDISVQPGKYTLVVAISDEGSGRAAADTVAFTAFSKAPRLSDLFLWASVRKIDSLSEANEREVVRGVYAMEVPSHLTMTVGAPDTNIHWYVEMYPGTSDVANVPMTASVWSDKQQIYKTPPKSIPVKGSGGADLESVNLEGLPPGEYRLVINAKFPDGSNDSVSAPFTMRMPVAGAPTAAPASSSASLTDAEVGRMVEPTGVFLTGSEATKFKNLSPAGRVDYTRAFWSKAPYSADARDFLKRIDLAKQLYATSRQGQGSEGWSTDRGRIFLRYGAPGLRRQASPGASKPAEIWCYNASGKQLEFIFVDDTGNGNFRLIFSNDPTERLSNMREVSNLVQADGELKDILSNLGSISGGGCSS